ncbi:hypothetical protein Drorol1_Dr00022842 [Drosera rotundifolia]
MCCSLPTFSSSKPSMGNCVASKMMILDGNKDTGNHQQPSTTEAAAGDLPLDMKATTELIGHAAKGDKTRSVRFRLPDEEDCKKGDGTSCGGRRAVTIRVVMTQKELQQILSYKKSSSSCQYPSVEQLLSSLNLKRRTISAAVQERRDPGISNRWIPALESIPEDPHFSKYRA